jgi:amino acid transporter
MYPVQGERGATSGLAKPRASKLTLGPLVAAIYFIVAGWPFGLEEIVSKSGYAGAMLILLITPLIWSLPTALMVSELASAIPEEGGYYVWVTRALGRFWGFQEAWLSFVGNMFDVALYPMLFVSYLGHFSPAATAGARGLWIGAGLILAAALLNLLGAKVVAESSFAFSALLLSPFAALTVYALLHRAPAAHAIPLSHIDFLGGILIAMWNYMGWDNASLVANDVENPRRTYPLAMACAVGLVAFTYIAPIAAVATTGLDPNRWTEGGWAVVAGALWQGTGGAAIVAAMTAAGLIATFGTQNALTLAFARLPVALAEDGYLPSWLARKTRSGAPWTAIALCAAAWIACLFLSFSKLLSLDVLLTGTSLILEFAALVALRIRQPDLPRPFRIPGGTAAAVAIGIPPLALLILAAARSEVEQVGPLNALELGSILIAAGCAIYYFARRNK